MTDNLTPHSITDDDFLDAWNTVKRVCEDIVDDINAEATSAPTETDTHSDELNVALQAQADDAVAEPRLKSPILSRRNLAAMKPHERSEAVKDLPVCTSLEDIVVGAEYVEVSTGAMGIAIIKEEHMTGCDRAVLGRLVAASALDSIGGSITADVTMLVYVGEGISARVETVAELQAETIADKGGPAVYRP